MDVIVAATNLEPRDFESLGNRIRYFESKLKAYENGVPVEIRDSTKKEMDRYRGLWREEKMNSRGQ
jgi:hypothetical protein